MIQLHIVPGDELPIYRQIMRQVTDAVAGGRLRTGEKLPSQRELAEQLVVSPLTVKKAYDELERQGLIQTRRGRGTFVSTAERPIDPGPQRERLRGAVRRLLSQAHLASIELEDVVALLHEVDEALRAERARRAELRNDSTSGGEPHEDR